MVMTNAERRARYTAANPLRVKHAVRTHRYNFTPEQYDAMLDAQGGVCAICKRVNENGRDLYIDHDHKCCDRSGSCGRCIRGLLCSKCNGALGSFDDDPSILEAAIAYLKGN